MVDNQITFTESAQIAYLEAVDLIREARDWQLTVTIGDDLDAAAEQLRERRQLVDDMERSLLVTLLALMTIGQKHDGPLHIVRDMQSSFFWSHEQSKYHGGLIFHRNHKIDDAIIGTWSIHT